MKINILSTIDKNYFPIYKIMITSLLENTSSKKNIQFYLIEKDLDKWQKKDIKNYVHKYGAHIKILPRPLFNFDSFPRVDHISDATYYKIYYLDKINVNKIIYTDPDVIFLSDVKELFKKHLHDKTIGGVKDYALGLRRNCNYINAGILLIDVNHWKKRKCALKLLKELKKNSSHFVYAEQDLINNILPDQISFLDESWNRQKIIYDHTPDKLHINKKKYNILLSSPHAIHYTGRIKPWHFKYVFPDKKYWLKYAKIANVNQISDWRIKDIFWKIFRWSLYKTKTREFFELNIWNKIH